MPVITFKPSGKTVSVAAGTLLIDACRQAGFRLSAPCGGKGLCGKCRVRMLEGDIPADKRQTACLPARMLDDNWRAACVADVAGDLTVADPEDGQAGVVLTDFMSREAKGGSGLWEKTVEMRTPSTEDQSDDLARFSDALSRHDGEFAGDEPEVPLTLLARLPDLLRAGKFRCRAVGLGRRVLDVEPAADPASPRYGLAVDIGTTTLAAALCDLRDGRIVAVASRGNPQAARGDDVITRVDYASKGRAELHELRGLVVGALEEMSAEVVRQAGATTEPLVAAIGANTVMNHLLLGVSPKALALSPFIPAFKGARTLCASEIGWRGPRPPLAYIVPNISAYVGGDIIAGILAHSVADSRGTTLFLDVGTNGEIALATDGRVYACATAAGPAFEGARIRQGMRAAPGAISRVGLTSDGKLDIGVVDNIRPAVGLCGTGLLDAVAALLTAGIVDESGRIVDADEAEELGNPPSAELIARIHELDDGPAVWLEPPDGNGEGGVSLTQRDVREFQLAKGAIAAGVAVLLGAAGVPTDKVDSVLLAGGFGNYLDPAAAMRVGLLPEGIRAETVKSVGNASLAGARLCLLSGWERTEAEKLSRYVKYIELSGRGDFQEAFGQEILFPER